jgi:hypothetical protein
LSAPRLLASVAATFDRVKRLESVRSLATSVDQAMAAR